MNIPGDVIPLNKLGVIDTDLSQLNHKELLRHGLVNLWKHGKEGGYLVQHSSQPASDFPLTREGTVVTANYWESTFPFLFPYGMGGIEKPRPVSLSLTEHVK